MCYVNLDTRGKSLYNLQYIVFSSGTNLLVMENASLGNLKQYLQAIEGPMYSNVTSMKSTQSEMNFIHQIIDGVIVVHQLRVREPVVYTCWTAKCNVILICPCYHVQDCQVWDTDNINLRVHDSHFMLVTYRCRLMYCTLQPAALFHCLSASQVLVTSHNQCKLSGFSSKDSVVAREKHEEDNQVQRYGKHSFPFI